MTSRPLLLAVLVLALLPNPPAISRAGGTTRRVAVYSNDIDWGLCGAEITEAAARAGVVLDRVSDPSLLRDYDAVIVLGGHMAPTDRSMPDNIASDYLTPDQRSRLEGEPDAEIVVVVPGRPEIFVFAGHDRYDTRDLALSDSDGDGWGNAAEVVRGSRFDSPEGPLWGREVLLIVSHDGFQDVEYSTVRDHLESRGASISVASDLPGTARGVSGTEVHVDLTLDEVSVSDYDAVIFIGGPGTPQHLWGDGRAEAIASQAAALGIPLGAICLAPGVLADAGVLRGRRATVYPDPSAVQKLLDGGAEYVDEPVVVDGTIVTARDPAAARAFAREISRLLRW